MKEDIKVAKDTRGTNVWVLAELEEGKLMNVTFELLGKAKEMAAKIEEKVAAVLVCGEAGDMPAQLIAAGADIVYTVAGPEYADYTTDLYTDAVCQLNNKFAPRALMIAATVDGRDLAPRIAARLKTGLCADCTEVEMDEEGVVAWTRPALGGNIYASIVGNEKLPQMGTVRPKVFEAIAADASRAGEVVPFVVEGEHVSRVEIVSKTPLSTGNSIKIEDAEVLVSGGRGIGDASKLEMMYNVLPQVAQALASSLNGVENLTMYATDANSEYIGKITQAMNGFVKAMADGTGIRLGAGLAGVIPGVAPAANAENTNK